jgi:hypothetical protein
MFKHLKLHYFLFFRTLVLKETSQADFYYMRSTVIRGMTDRNVTAKAKDVLAG